MGYNVKGKVVPLHPMKAYCGNVLNLGMKVSGQLHVLTGLPLGKEPTAFIERYFGQISGPV
jgi:hypothetical protein